ncbi:MAG: bacillithiol biosynthesis cysteine-adding enzyme BshC [Flavobacteriaceae bacterium]|nr:bacillithiol biosynthesis cysteine-adding enzyme BshC [Flavobacteriaceae bacterium]
MNKITSLPLVETGLLSNLINDYLNQNQEVKDFYAHFPNIEEFKNQINKKKNFNQDKRDVLVSVLQSQNKILNLSDKTKFNILQLKKTNTFTVTTGHQLNLFTGPLYVIYKLLTTINLAEELQNKFPENYFVPIFWMATEDHDFAEINHFWVHHQKLEWNKKDGGAVGKLATDGLNDVFQQLKSLIINQPNAKYIFDLFEKSYLKHSNLADANKYLINELFGKFGLVILDGNDVQLKSQFKTFMADELLQNTCFKEVKKMNIEIAKKYKVQVNPREINLFYLMNNERQRIIFEDFQYKIHNTSKVFSSDEIITELNNFPERFSPNVLMRPLYQEVILPNLCYVGGAGELAYWLQLKSYFDYQKVEFPILLHRNSALILTKKQQNQLKKLKLTFDDLWMPLPQLINKKVKEISEITIDFEKERKYLNSMFLNLETIASKTDKSFIGAVKAQQQKQLNGLNKLEKRLLKAEKRKHQEYINQLTALHSELFPNGILQERIKNISEYLISNENIIDDLQKLLNPLSATIDIISMDL